MPIIQTVIKGKEPVIDTLSVTPSTSAQQITAPQGTDGYSPVNVSAVTSSIDANITASNIKSGVTILGTTGNVVELDGETTSVTPTTSQQTITPTSPHNGLTSVTVDAVTSSIDANITAGNIKDGVSILGVTGNYTGAGAVIDPLSITPSTSAQTFTASGGVDGYSPVSVSAVTAAIDANITAGNIKSGVSILGVSGSVTELNGSTTTINPSTSEQIVSPTSPSNGFTSVTVPAVTASIDANIQAGNIKKDVEILGVTGTYEGGGSLPDFYLEKTITSQGNLISSTTAPLMDFSGIKTIAEFQLRGAYQNNTTISGAVVFPDLIRLVTQSCCQYMFSGCPNITSFSCPKLIMINGSSSLGYAFETCSGLTSVSLPNLEYITGINACNYMCQKCPNLVSCDLSFLFYAGATYSVMQNMFYNDTSLTTVNLNNLTILSGQQTLLNTFYGCTSLTTFSFNRLCVTPSNSLQNTFQGCTGLTSLSFPNLAYSNKVVNGAFNNTLSGVTGCTVHFPAEWQTDMSSWSYITNGMGGTNTTVLFDLPNVTTLDLSGVKHVPNAGFGFQNWAQNSTFPNITAVNLENLVSVYKYQCFINAFKNCPSITSVDLSSLVYLDTTQAMSSAFEGTGLTTFRLDSLKEANASAAFAYTLKDCTSLLSVYFPSIKTVYGSSIFDGMLNGCSNVTVHFPSNFTTTVTASAIGGTNTTVSYDLPAVVVLTGANTTEYERNPKYDTATALAWRLKDAGAAEYPEIDFTPYYTSGTTDPTVGTTIYSDSACTVTETTVASIA